VQLRKFRIKRKEEEQVRRRHRKGRRGSTTCRIWIGNVGKNRKDINMDR
jgi:hypothetical protein